MPTAKLNIALLKFCVAQLNSMEELRKKQQFDKLKQVQARNKALVCARRNDRDKFRAKVNERIRIAKKKAKERKVYQDSVILHHTSYIIHHIKQILCSCMWS